MAFFGRLRQIGKGTKRLLMTLSLAATALAGVASLVWAYDTWYRVEQSWETVLIMLGVCTASFLGPFIIIWLGTRLVLWIGDGFGQSTDHADPAREPGDAIDQPPVARAEGKGVVVLRVVIWIALGAGFLRGLPVFDAGGSFGLDGVGAGLCFATAVLGSVLMFCFDVRRKTD